MIKPLQIKLPYKDKMLTVHAEWVYESEQIQRIKVSVKTNTILLQNNFPKWKASNSRKRIDWKIKEGMFKDADFFLLVITHLEMYLKKYGDTPKTNPKNDHDNHVNQLNKEKAEKQKLIDDKFKDMENPWQKPE